MAENLENGINSTKNLEDMDDDVVELVDVSANMNTQNRDTTSAVVKDAKNSKRKKNVPRPSATNSKGNNVTEHDPDDKEAKKLKSEVWIYMDKVGIVDGVEKCRCNHCRKLLTCKYGSGTTHLKRHLEKCLQTPKYHGVSALIDNRATLLKKWKFDPMLYREVLAKAIIKHDLPFSFAEYDGIIEVNKVLNPEFKSVCRNTAKSDCLKVYETEKGKLKSLLAAHSRRICLTSDCWTAVTTRSYMTVTAHFIDSNWRLNSKLLAFGELDAAHTGLELSSKLLAVLKDWGIESKIFSVTLDNASSNDSMVRILKDRLNLQDGLLCQGEFFHIRCCAHILNLIVQDGLKCVDGALKKIRKSVTYVKFNDGRLREFRKCIEEVNLANVGGSFLRSDVTTRWNSTYTMLETAIKYRRAFTSLSYNDTNYKHCPTNEEWERAGRISSFLAPFEKITNMISGSSYPTSSLYFRQIASIEMKLNDFLNSEDEVIKNMAKIMKVKFDKYWESYCSTLAFGSVLDPKGKMQYLTFVYKKLYPNDYEGKVKIVKDSMYKLFAEYERRGKGSSNTTSLASSSSMTTSSDDMNEFDIQFLQESSIVGKSELDVYLEESPEPLASKNSLEALDYWKTNAPRFPRLAMMASDILSIPITTVASESTFGIGGRILHKYRSCLLSDNVQALICTRNWLHGFQVDDDSDVQEVEEIKLTKEDSNVVDVEDSSRVGFGF